MIIFTRGTLIWLACAGNEMVELVSFDQILITVINSLIKFDIKCNMNPSHDIIA